MDIHYQYFSDVSFCVAFFSLNNLIGLIVIYKINKNSFILNIFSRKMENDSDDYPETTMEKIQRKFTKEPLIPIGAALTVGFLV